MNLRIPISLHGVKVLAHLVSNPGIRYLIAATDIYEYREAQCVEEFIKADDRVLELGGAIGVISCVIGKKAKEGEVLSYEPNLEVLRTAKSNVKANRLSNVTHVNAVLGTSRVEKQLFYLDENFLTSSLFPNGMKQIEVKSQYFLDVIQKFKPTAIVMDIEGGEYALLSESDFVGHSSIDRMIIEFHDVVSLEDKFNDLHFLWEQYACPLSLKEVLETTRKEGHSVIPFTRRRSFENGKE